MYSKIDIYALWNSAQCVCLLSYYELHVFMFLTFSSYTFLTHELLVVSSIALWMMINVFWVELILNPILSYIIFHFLICCWYFCRCCCCYCCCRCCRCRCYSRCTLVLLFSRLMPVSNIWIVTMCIEQGLLISDVHSWNVFAVLLLMPLCYSCRENIIFWSKQERAHD